MRKLFLFMISAVFSIVAIAGNEWSLENGTIKVKYNQYGEQDADGTSIQWQAGNAAAFPDAVEEASGNTLWTPALGEKFMVTLKGTANMTGKMQMFMADEREEVSYWTPLCATYGEVEVVAGEAFTLETVFTVDKVAFDEETLLTVPDLVLAYEYPGTSEDEGFDATEDFVISDATLEILYAEAADLVDPITLSYSKQDGDFYQYQGILNSKVTVAKAGLYANVKFEGVAQNDITTLMYALVDNSEEAGWWKQMTDEMVFFKANIKKGDKVSVQFSFEITGETPSSSPVFKDVLLANAESKGMSVDFSNASIEVSVTDRPVYSYSNIKKFTVSLRTNDDSNYGGYYGNVSGNVYGMGEYFAGTSVTISAVPHSRCVFKRWSDGITDNPRTLIVDNDITLIAEFVPLECNVRLYAEGNGSVKGEGVYEYNTEVEISATPAPFGHFVRWSDGSTANPRKIVVKGDEYLYAYFEMDTLARDGLTYQFINEKEVALTKFGVVEVEVTQMQYEYALSTVVMGGAKSANGAFYTSDYGVQTKWQLGDFAGNVIFCFQTIYEAFQFISGTEAQNEIVKAQASETKFAVIGDAKASKFEQLSDEDFTETVVTISRKLETGKKAVAFKNDKCQGFFEIVNYSAESEDLTLNIWTVIEGGTSYTYTYTYTYIPFEGEVLDVPSSVMYKGASYPVTSIDAYFDETNNTLKTVYLGENISSIDNYTFEYCPSLTNVYSYAKTPPEIGRMTFANMNGYLYVPCDYYESYDLHAQWGNFKHIECISSAESVLDNDDVVVTPDINNALFAMPMNSSANSYSLTISKDGEVFCTLNFNANGQLTNIDFSSLKAYELKDAVSGYEFTVTGLSSASDYAYSYVAKDASKQVIKEYTGKFSTKNTDGTGGSFSSDLGSEGGEQGGADSNYTIAVVTLDNAKGSVMGTGSYKENASATLIAIPSSGYKFVKWNDGNTENPRIITVTADAVFTAIFEEATGESESAYTITVVASDNTMGVIVGAGKYEAGETATLAVVPSKGYQFVQWNDGNTDNPRVITVTENMFLVATFEKISTAINEVESTEEIVIVNRQILVNGEAPEFVTTVLGQRIANKNLKSGIYFVQSGNKQIGVSIR
ncbi:MAG: hypothetical protein MJ198_04540 [Bacteroidales bacterium]|nr:hypothetical protein [Bacteroidales bacterium]